MIVSVYVCVRFFCAFVCVCVCVVRLCVCVCVCWYVRLFDRLVVCFPLFVCLFAR